MAPASPSPATSSARSASSDVDPAVDRLVTLLRDIERAQDDLLALGGEFQAAFIDAQRRVGIGPAVTQPAMRHFLDAQAHQAAARGSWVDGHRQIRRIAVNFGIAFPAEASDGYGDNSKYPPPPFTGTDAASPRAAA